MARDCVRPSFECYHPLEPSLERAACVASKPRAESGIGRQVLDDFFHSFDIAYGAGMTTVLFSKNLRYLSVRIADKERRPPGCSNALELAGDNQAFE